MAGTSRLPQLVLGAEQLAQLQQLGQSRTAPLREVQRSAHISKETRTFLASRPNRFQYVLTPKHGSWLNIVETLFGKTARTFLRHIRVQAWEELRQRMLLGIAEINAAPVVHRWQKFDALTQADQNAI